MSEYTLKLFGSPAILSDGTEVDFALKKGIGLVAWLARARKQMHRDQAAALFWPESGQKSARTSLRRTLHRLNALLDEPLVIAKGEYLHTSPILLCDSNKYQQDLGALQPGDADYGIDLPVLRAAVDGYQDFMRGFSIPDLQDFEEWILLERQALEQTQSRALDELTERLAQDGQIGLALEYAQRWGLMDPLNEPVQRVLINLLISNGQIAEAHRQYDTLAQGLLDEIGVAPSPATRALFNDENSQLEALVPETRYVKSGEVYIAFQVLGSGPIDIIQIPGFVSHLDVVWEEPGMVDFYTKLAENFRVILFDRRGVGLSDRIGYHPSAEDTAQDVLAIMDEVGSQKAVVMGVSEGGPSGIHVVTHYPERFRGLVLYGTMARGSRDADYPWMPDSEILESWLDRLIARWGQPAYITMFAPSMAADIGFRRWWTRMLTRGATPGTLRGVITALRNSDVRVLLGAVNVPSLVVHRKGDQAIALGNATYLAENIPGAQYVELPGNDHWWWVGERQPILDAIFEFVSTLD